MTYKITTIVGARPQFIKAAAVSRALAQKSEVSEVIVHTGQHHDQNMSEVFFRELSIPTPAHNLGVHGGAHGQMTGRMLEAIEQCLIDNRPDLLLIYGDTNSTLAGALAAAKLHIPVAHVEAGLRSFNRRMPEEINRILADHVSSLLFCPTREAVRNLAQEGIFQGVHHSGDVMYDATLHARAAATASSTIVDRLRVTPGNYAVCTLHRSENTESEEHLRSIVNFVEAIEGPSVILFPVHPRTRRALQTHGILTNKLTMIDPLGYFDMHALLASASVVLTDSGGLQKEAYFHGVPCVTLRDETEWVETIQAGWNRLWRSEAYSSPRVAIDDYGTGDAATTIADTIEDFLDAQAAPA